MKSLENRRKKFLDSFNEIDEVKNLKNESYRDGNEELFELLKTGDEQLDKNLKGMIKDSNIKEKDENVKTEETIDKRKKFLEMLKVEEKDLKKMKTEKTESRNLLKKLEELEH